MKSILALGVLVALSVGLAAWIDHESPSAAAEEAADDGLRDARLFQRSVEAMANIQSAHIVVEIVSEGGGQRFTIKQTVDVESPQRMHVRTTLAGYDTEFFTDGPKICVRNGLAWVPVTQPLASPGREVVQPTSIERLADTILDGEAVYHFEGVIEGAEVERILAGTSFEELTYQDGIAEYFVERETLHVKKSRLNIRGSVGIVAADVTVQTLYTRINEDVTLLPHVPATCSEPSRTF